MEVNHIFLEAIKKALECGRDITLEQEQNESGSSAFGNVGVTNRQSEKLTLRVFLLNNNEEEEKDEKC